MAVRWAVNQVRPALSPASLWCQWCFSPASWLCMYRSTWLIAIVRETNSWKALYRKLRSESVAEVKLKYINICINYMRWKEFLWAVRVWLVLTDWMGRRLLCVRRRWKSHSLAGTRLPHSENMFWHTGGFWTRRRKRGGGKSFRWEQARECWIKKLKKKSIVFGCKSMTVYIIALLRMKWFTTIITSRHCLPLVPDSVYKTALECLWNK